MSKITSIYKNKPLSNAAAKANALSKVVSPTNTDQGKKIGLLPSLVCLLPLITVPLSTNSNLLGCSASYGGISLSSTAHYLRGLPYFLLVLPACNGLLGYLAPLLLVIIFVRQQRAIFVTLALCVLTEILFRTLYLHDNEWSVWLLTAHKALPATVVALILSTLTHKGA